MSYQRSILEFARAKSEVESKQDPQTQENTSDSVKCPVCMVSLLRFEMDDKIRHVEECLLLSVIEYPAEPKPKPSPPKRLKAEINADTKKRQLEKQKVQIEKRKYINSDANLKKRRLDQPVKEQSPQKQLFEAPSATPSVSRRRPIPTLKTLTFAKNPFDSYEVSVDAFSFRLHDTISKYVLSHFHSDHYGGISKKWCLENSPTSSKIILCSVITAKLLRIRFNIDETYLRPMEMDQRYLVQDYGDDFETEISLSQSTRPGLYISLMTANHCPGAAIFLFESIDTAGESTYMLHCGDFRVNKAMLQHPFLQPFHKDKVLLKVYLDTTYMSKKYNFPKQEVVCEEVSDMFYTLVYEDKLYSKFFGTLQSRISDFLTRNKKKRLLILVGTYLIGKERVAMAILKKLNNCPIFVSNIKSRGDKEEIIDAYEDPFLTKVLTRNDLGNSDCKAVIHLVPMPIISSLAEMTSYFNHNRYFEHFERCVGVRPSGWTFEDKEDEEGVKKEVIVVKEECGVKVKEELKNENEKEDLKVKEEVREDIKVKEEPQDVVVEEEPQHIKVEQVKEEPKEFKLETLFVDVKEEELYQEPVGHNPPDPSELRDLFNALKISPKFNYLDDVLSQIPKPSARKKEDTSLYRIYGVPYSEHSSYRELAYFVVFLNIDKVIPTVNTHNEWSVMRMDKEIKLWEALKRLRQGNDDIEYQELVSDIRALSLDDF